MELLDQQPRRRFNPAVLNAPLLDHRGLDLSAARRVRYVLEQSFRYEYDAPVRSLRQRLMIVPPARHGRQHLRAHRLDVTGAQVSRQVRRSVDGNVIALLRAEHVPEAIEFRLVAVVERVRDDSPVLLPASALHSPRLLRATPLTVADDRLRDMAAEIARESAGSAAEDTAELVNIAVSRALSYSGGVTTVETTAAEAAAGGRGVCQDYAHVMLAVCHVLGLPARYVSGHLLGQGGTHAWVEVIVARGGQAEAVAFDPCNARRANGGYLTIATGRDYSDVAPTSGSYSGTAAGRLTAQRRVGVVAAALPAGLESGMTTDRASQLDSADPLARFRARFAGVDDPAVVAYLDGNSLGRPLAVTADRLAEFVSGAWGRRLIRSWDESWMAEPVTVGDQLGQLVLGAAPGQVTVADSTSVLLYKLIRAAVAARGERTEILIERGNFPTDRFIVDGVAAECGVTVRYLSPPPDAGVRPADVTAALSERTALVVLSHVAYRSGFLADMDTITRAVHDAGALMLWDLCHSAGALPVELDACAVDLAVGCTYKYLNGGPGSPAFCYVATQRQDELRQPIWGWMGAADPFAMGAEYQPAKGIRQFISGTPPVLAMQPLKDMLELIAEAGLPAIRRKSVALTEQAIALTDELLAPLGAVLASPRAVADRGSHVTVDHPRFAEVTAALWKRGVIPDFRPPDGIRVGLSPLSTSFAELERGIEAIAAELRRPAGGQRPS